MSSYLYLIHKEKKIRMTKSLVLTPFFSSQAENRVLNLFPPRTHPYGKERFCSLIIFIFEFSCSIILKKKYTLTTFFLFYLFTHPSNHRTHIKLCHLYTPSYTLKKKLHTWICETAFVKIKSFHTWFDIHSTLEPK